MGRKTEVGGTSARQLGGSEALSAAVVEFSREGGIEEALSIACGCFARRLGWEWGLGGAPERRDSVTATGGTGGLVERAVAGMSRAMLLEPARALGGALELALEGETSGRMHARKRAGAYFTPAWLIEHVLDTGLAPAIAERGGTVSVLDPACGSGLFLVAAARRLAARGIDWRGSVIGVDVNSAAVMLARFALWVESGGTASAEELSRWVVIGDSLLGGAECVLPRGGVDVVVGNPPFLNQLESGTAHGRARAAALRERYGEVARCYADASAVFLEMAVRSVRPGGRVAMVQPQSLLSSRDAAPVRRSVLSRGVLTDLWVAQEQVFGASVLVCVPTVRIGAAGDGVVRRSVGADVRVLPEARVSVEEVRAMETWGPLVAVAHEIPEFAVASRATLGAYATATADFRDQFYGLRGRIVEDAEVEVAWRAGRPPHNFPRLVTTGLIDPAECRWGQVPTRIDKRVWEQPRLNLELLAKDPELLRWARSRLVPKVLLATQTKVLEAAVDERGDWVPVTPLISVVPLRIEDVWRLGAALCSPVLSAWALREYAGAGLSASAIKLSAKQVLRLPAPPDEEAWDEGAGLFRAASGALDAAERLELLLRCGEVMCAAYGVAGAAAEALAAWWRERLPKKHRSVVAAIGGSVDGA